MADEEPAPTPKLMGGKYLIFISFSALKTDQEDELVKEASRTIVVWSTFVTQSCCIGLNMAMLILAVRAHQIFQDENCKLFFLFNLKPFCVTLTTFKLG